VVLKLESKVERAVCQHAQHKGWVALKLNGPGDRGKPDRLFMGPGGRVIVVEFKRPGAKPRKLQRWWQSRLQKLGHAVYVIDNEEDGYALFG